MKNSIFAALVCCFLLSCNATNEQQTDQTEAEVTTFIENLYAGTGGLTVHPNGDIYVSDFGPVLSGIQNLTPKNRVFRISPEGEVTVVAQCFEGASGSKFDDQGNFYQSNVRAGYVTKITPDGVIDTVFADGMRSPVGISTDDEGNLYVTNCDAHIIKRITPEGDTSTFSNSTLLRCPNGLTRDEAGNFYTSNFYNGDLVKITPDGEASLLATIPGNNNGHVLYHDDALYVVARAAHQIYRVTMDGKMAVFAGSGERGRSNGSRREARFSFPNDLDVSPDGKYLYVNEIADTVTDHRILTPTTVRRIRMP